MHCSPKLLEAVASQLKPTVGQYPWQIELGLLGMEPPRKVSRRAVRYAVQTLEKGGRALRLGDKKLIYAAPELL